MIGRFLSLSRNAFATLLARVGARRACPVCGRTAGQFRPAGRPPRADAQCPWCRALERHRLLWLFLVRRTDLFDGTPRRVLHVAPEPALEARLAAALGNGYLTADLDPTRAMVRMDLTDIPEDDATFDVIYCSHVLEHIPDDRKAIAECFRVLKPGGWAILLVPICGDTIVEDPTITDPRERERRFGQHDHVRIYGRDYVTRLAGAGFDVETVTPRDLATEEEIERHGLTKFAGDIYFCKKPQ